MWLQIRSLNIKLLLGLMVISAPFLSFSQTKYWEKLGENTPGRVRYLYATDSLLFIGSETSQGKPGIFSWDNASLHDFADSCLNGGYYGPFIYFNDTLYLSGSCGFVFYNGSFWQPVQSYFFSTLFSYAIEGFYSYQNTLYALGSFRLPGNNTAATQKIIHYNGQDWEFTDTTLWYGGPMAKAIEFQDKLYIIGGMVNYDGSIDNLTIWDDGKWHPVGGNPMIGNFGAGSFTVYQNDLWLTGYFFKDFGHPGDKVARWNGTDWLDPYSSFSQNEIVQGILVHENKLYLYGTFEQFAGQPIKNLAVWDGEKWCGYDMDMPEGYGIGSMAVFQDTLYIAGAFKVVDGDTVNHIAKWTGKNLEKYCTERVSTAKPDGKPKHLKVYPTLTDNLVHIDLGGYTDQIITFKLTDVMGRILQTGYLNSGNLNSLSFSNYSKGMYILSINIDEHVVTNKIIKH
jgi:hypothetical protein